MDLSWAERDFSNTVNPDLFDSTTTRARVTGRFSPAGTVTGRVFAEQEDYDTEDLFMTERQNRSR